MFGHGLWGARTSWNLSSWLWCLLAPACQKVFIRGHRCLGKIRTSLFWRLGLWLSRALNYPEAVCSARTAVWVDNRLSLQPAFSTLTGATLYYSNQRHKRRGTIHSNCCSYPYKHRVCVYINCWCMCMYSVSVYERFGNKLIKNRSFFFPALSEEHRHWTKIAQAEKWNPFQANLLCVCVCVCDWCEM